MIVEQTIHVGAWRLRELGEMEVAALGFIYGVLLSTPFQARKRIQLKYRFNETTSIHISNLKDESTSGPLGTTSKWKTTKKGGTPTKFSCARSRPIRSISTAWGSITHRATCIRA
jgi:hypothetical protein